MSAEKPKIFSIKMTLACGTWSWADDLKLFWGHFHKIFNTIAFYFWSASVIFNAMGDSQA